MKKSYLIIALVMALQLVLFQNCGKKVSFSSNSAISTSGNPDGGSDEANCQTTFVEETGIVKIIFLIDTSGSNQSPGTDPGKVWRSAVLDNFLSKYQQKTNFYYNIITFHNSSAKSYITASGQPVFSNDQNVVNQAVNNFLQEQDTGNTPYKSALNLATSLINNDLSTDTNGQNKYAIIMLSDGQPNPDYNTGTNVAAAEADVQAIISIASGRINFNGVFYYNQTSDPTDAAQAESFLQSMAIAGNGAFIKASSNQSLQIDDVIKIPKTNCQ